MKYRKHFLENALRTLGLGIVLAYALCFVCARLKLFGICPMDRGSLTIGFALILVSTLGTEKHKTQTPEQIISTGIIVLCSVLVMVLLTALTPFLPDTVPFLNVTGFGIGIGIVIGLGINKSRPTYAESMGLWRSVLHFVVTQMDFDKAFKHEAK